MSESSAQLTASALSSLTGRSVLITGGAGYFGSRLARLLTGPCDVKVLDNLLTGDAARVPDGAELVRGGVNEVGPMLQAMADTSIAFHHAQCVPVDHSVRSPVETHKRVANGALTLLDTARRTDTEVVLGSSAAVYGDVDTLPVQETTSKNPVSPFGAATLAADHHGRLYADLYGLPVTTLRYFNVYGPDAPPWEAVSTFLRRAKAGRPLVVHGDGNQTRDFVHVRDATRGTLQAAADGSDRVYNIGTGTDISIRELAELVTERVGGSSDIVHTDARPQDIRHSRADIERARTDFDYRPTVDLRDTIESPVDGESSDPRLSPN